MTTATTFTTSNSMKKISCLVQKIILEVTVFLILLCSICKIFIVADMNKSNLSYVHLEKS